MLRVQSFTIPVPGGGGGHPEQPGQSGVALAQPQRCGAVGPLPRRVCGPELVSVRAVSAHSSQAVPGGLKALAEGSAPQPPVSPSARYPGTAQEGAARAVAAVGFADVSLPFLAGLPILPPQPVSCRGHPKEFCCLYTPSQGQELARRAGSQDAGWPLCFIDHFIVSPYT